jgi:hypothetical protein
MVAQAEWTFLYCRGEWLAARTKACERADLARRLRSAHALAHALLDQARSEYGLDDLDAALNTAQLICANAHGDVPPTVEAAGSLLRAEILARSGQWSAASALLHDCTETASDRSRGAMLYVRWHSLSGLDSLRRMDFDDTIEHLISITSDGQLLSNVQALAAACELAALLCCKSQEAVRAAPLLQCISELDRRAVLRRKPLQERWLHAQGLVCGAADTDTAESPMQDLLAAVQQYLQSLTFALAVNRVAFGQRVQHRASPKPLLRGTAETLNCRRAAQQDRAPADVARHR